MRARSRWFRVKLPDNIDELASLYRSLLSNKRVLLFFDNTAARRASLTSASADRMRHACYITHSYRVARHQQIRLGELSPTEARELLLGASLAKIDPSGGRLNL